MRVIKIALTLTWFLPKEKKTNNNKTTNWKTVNEHRKTRKTYRNCVYIRHMPQSHQLMYEITHPFENISCPILSVFFSVVHRPIDQSKLKVSFFFFRFRLCYCEPISTPQFSLRLEFFLIRFREKHTAEGEKQPQQVNKETQKNNWKIRLTVKEQ